MYRSLLLLLLGLGLCGQSVRSEGVDPSLDRAQEEGRRLQSGEITEISKEVKSAMEDLLLKEFGNESSDSADGDPAGKDYNATVEGESSQIETVVRISGSGSTPSSSNSSSAAFTSEAMGEEEPLSAAELIAAEGNMERSVDSSAASTSESMGEEEPLSAAELIAAEGNMERSVASRAASTSEAMGEEEPLSAAELIAAEGNMERSVDSSAASTSEAMGEEEPLSAAELIAAEGNMERSVDSRAASTSEAMGEEEPLSAAELIAAEGNMERSVDRIIDRHDNTFILSNPSSHVASLTLDAQLVADITVVLAAASVFGAVFEFFGQPTINGYLVAGALVGPGGLNLIMELVQVESLAQLGVSLLLFGLGMELDLKKLKAVWGVTMIAALVFAPAPTAGIRHVCDLTLATFLCLVVAQLQLLEGLIITARGGGCSAILLGGSA
eukprot:gene20213-26959_t